MDPTVEDGEHSWLLQVTDLKQYEYCPRVVYYRYCLPGIRPTTYKMEAGIAAQDRVAGLEERRSLRAYGLQSGRRHFNVPVISTRLRCSGQVDMVVETEEDGRRRLVPVDFKLSRREPGRHFKLQLACYGFMLEESWGFPADRGFLYLIQARRAVPVSFTPRLRRDAERVLAQIAAMVGAQRTPEPTARRSRCVNCEFRRFCNDVI